MSALTRFFRFVLKKPPTRVREVKEFKLIRTVFTISDVSNELDNIVRISGEPTLLLPPGGRISIDDAHQRTGLSKRKLRELAEKGDIDSKRVRGQWLLSEVDLANLGAGDATTG